MGQNENCAKIGIRLAIASCLFFANLTYFTSSSVKVTAFQRAYKTRSINIFKQLAQDAAMDNTAGEKSFFYQCCGKVAEYIPDTAAGAAQQGVINAAADTNSALSFLLESKPIFGIHGAGSALAWGVNAGLAKIGGSIAGAAGAGAAAAATPYVLAGAACGILSYKAAEVIQTVWKDLQTHIIAGDLTGQRFTSTPVIGKSTPNKIQDIAGRLSNLRVTLNEQREYSQNPDVAMAIRIPSLDTKGDGYLYAGGLLFKNKNICSDDEVEKNSKCFAIVLGNIIKGVYESTEKYNTQVEEYNKTRIGSLIQKLPSNLASLAGEVVSVDQRSEFIEMLAISYMNSIVKAIDRYNPRDLNRSKIIEDLKLIARQKENNMLGFIKRFIPEYEGTLQELLTYLDIDIHNPELEPANFTFAALIKVLFQLNGSTILSYVDHRLFKRGYAEKYADNLVEKIIDLGNMKKYSELQQFYPYYGYILPDADAPLTEGTLVRFPGGITNVMRALIDPTGTQPDEKIYFLAPGPGYAEDYQNDTDVLYNFYLLGRMCYKAGVDKGVALGKLKQILNNTYTRKDEAKNGTRIMVTAFTTGFEMPVFTGGTEGYGGL